MQNPENVCGLPWLSSKPERAIFKELEFACVYAVGPSGGRPLKIGWARQLKDRMQAIQLGSWKELEIHHIVWTPGDMLAVRLFNEVADLLDKGKRRMVGDWFDVTSEFAKQAIDIASTKIAAPVLTHGEMLAKVSGIRKDRINAICRAF